MAKHQGHVVFEFDLVAAAVCGDAAVPTVVVAALVVVVWLACAIPYPEDVAVAERKRQHGFALAVVTRFVPVAYFCD